MPYVLRGATFYLIMQNVNLVEIRYLPLIVLHKFNCDKEITITFIYQYKDIMTSIDNLLKKNPGGISSLTRPMFQLSWRSSVYLVNYLVQL